MSRRDLSDWIYQPTFEEFWQDKEVHKILKEQREAHFNNLNEKTKKEVSK